MPYWEYEYRLDEIHNTIEKENKEQEGASSGSNPDKMSRNMMKSAERSMSNFKMPSMPSMPSMPKI